MNETDRKLLTEYLGECWHEWQYIKGSIRQELFQCCKCGEACKGVASEEQKQRTFTTREDMMDLYQAIWRTSWMDFAAFMYPKYGEACGFCGYVAWLFCLSGEGYDAACQRVADWIKEGI